MPSGCFLREVFLIKEEPRCNTESFLFHSRSFALRALNRAEAVSVRFIRLFPRFPGIGSSPFRFGILPERISPELLSPEAYGLSR